MTNDSISLFELLRKVGMDKDTDFLREGVKALSQAIIELEAAEKIGAGSDERSAGRLTHRNGYREREWDTRVGTIPLRIPKVRQGSFFPSLLEPRRRAERALVAVIQEAYVHGVSTRKVDDLVQALGLTGMSRSEVSRLCQELDEMVETFRARRLEVSTPISGLMPPTTRSVKTAGSRAWPWWWRSECGRPGNARCWASTSARPKTARSGSPSCAAWSPAAWLECSS